MNPRSKFTLPHRLSGRVSKQFFLILLLAISATFFSACKKSADEPEAGSAPGTIEKAAPAKDQKGSLHKVYVDSSLVWVEIADNEESRGKGLMWRDAMPQDQGMLFVFPNPEYQSFWMRNTYIPLDIAFIDANWKITDIHHMEPIVDTVYYQSTVPVPYALEVNQGWFAKHGVRVGDKIRLE